MELTILITGANKGIGFETARQLAEMGHRVIITGRNRERIKHAQQSLHEMGFDKVHRLKMNVGSDKSVAKAAARVKEWGMLIDVIINNAGVLLPDDFDLTKNEPGILEETLNINSLGPERVIRSFLPLMNYPGRIINVSSGGGSMSEPVGGWAPAYCCSKTLLNAMTRQMAASLQARGIAVNAVCPGWVRTDMGGSSAPRDVREGAATQVWLATDPDLEFTGMFFRDKQPIPW
ncbi:MAG: SDR family oxidoreductase [Salibacteraceae bacterium]